MINKFSKKQIQQEQAKNLSIEDLLKKNNSLMNTHIGERCFVLGNGPSLKHVDFSLLADEFVFTVNNAYLIDDFEKLKTNAHLWIDAAYFGLRSDMKLDVNVVLDYYHKIAKQKPIFFAIPQGYGFIRKYNLDKILDVYYILQAYPDIEQSLHIDIRYPMSCFRTVTQYAICIAIFMGFKEIYLLGCDATSILGVVNRLLNLPNTEHAYDEAKNTSYVKSPLEMDKDYFDKKNFSLSPVTFSFLEEYKVFLGYDKLSYICRNLLNVKLINCSAETLIQGIPRMNFYEVLKK